MEFLIRSAQIIDKSSSFHLQHKDLLISNGIIKTIADNIEYEGQIIEADGLCVSIGWMDMRAHYQDPGNEHKEDLESGAAVSASGGFTDVLLLPNTSPVISSKNAVSYYHKWNKSSAVQLHPMAALTLGCEGKELTEMIDLYTAGAQAFSDGLRPVWHSDIMLKGLQYLQKFNGLLINKAEDEMLSSFGHMNEGKVSTLMGLKGIPVLAETLMIQRDLNLLEYTGGRLHISLVSSGEGLELIRVAKKKGLNVTCDVGVNYLKFTDEDLQDYDTSLKVSPPYRTETDRMALLDGILDGTVDCLVSDHIPHDEESKKLEFDLADFGSSNQQTFFGVVSEALGGSLFDSIELFTSKPRKLLQLRVPQIKEGESACLTLFNNDEWTMNDHTNKSKSVASPLFGQTIKGKVLGIINNGQLVLNDI
jgi:dihydroorotase